MVERVIHGPDGQIIDNHSSNHIATGPEDHQSVTINEAAGKVFRSGPQGDEILPRTYQVSAADLAPEGSGVLASARWNGAPIQPGPEHDPSTITVKVPGTDMETGLDVAMQMGLVQRNPVTGAYVEGTDPVATDTQEQEQGEPQPVAFDQQGEANLQAIVDAYSPELQVSLMETAMQGQLESRLNDFAAVGGMTPEALSERVNHAMQAFQKQADDVVREHGHEPAEVWGWLRELNPDGMHDTMRRHVLGRDPSVWADVAREFARHAPRSAESLRQAGHEVRTSQNGLSLVVVNGMEVDAQAAAMMGLI